MASPPDAQKETTTKRRGLWHRPRSRWALGIPLGGALMFVLGILSWVGFSAGLEATNELGFCVSCHEMHVVDEEYRESAHYSNASGIRAVCADCHVPQEFIPKMVRKVKSAREVYVALTGGMDTREEFEAKRLELAERVWKNMRSNDSKACRTCHTYESMNLAKQQKQAQARHDVDQIRADGKTCIDCHTGVAHKPPKRSYFD